MSNRMPSLLALLGLAAVAGYQNRDQLKSLINRGMPVGPDQETDALNTRPESQNPGGAVDYAGTLQNGIRDLIDRFKGLGDNLTPQSWVATGQNTSVTPDQLRGVLGDDVVADLARKTGLTEVNLMSRLSQVLPGLVDNLTPDGVVLAPDESFPAAR
jgi:uncharacterized protein YidB (DUF937 family)